MNANARKRQSALNRSLKVNHARPKQTPEKWGLSTTHVSLQAHQPDDRPFDPNEVRSRHILLPSDVTYTERKSMTLKGWVGVVAKCDRMDNSGTGHNKRTPIR